MDVFTYVHMKKIARGVIFYAIHNRHTLHTKRIYGEVDGICVIS